MRYYLIVGEASGDMHAANLMHALYQKDKQAVFCGFGGDLMQQEGLQLIKHYHDLAFMGFTEVLLNLRTIFKNLALCRQEILKFQPDVVILVDYPGFNLRMAKWLKQQKIKTFYYISPQIWAWNQKRGKKIKRLIDKMFCILPFEKDFYKKFDYTVDYVGHPLLDSLKKEPKEFDIEKFKEKYQLDERPIVALFPGSRRQEIQKVLPVMISVVEQFRDVQFVIGGVSQFDIDFYHQWMQNKDIRLIYKDARNLLRASKAALVTSGTASLETALLKIPEVICYKGSRLNYLIARQLIRVPYIGLANLIMNRPMIKELIQYDLTKENLQKELNLLLNDHQKRQQFLTDSTALIEVLGNGSASETAAQLMIDALK
ncbi:MAG: lipid-A-disaccharide synthase [Bacteroidales bacterium]|nr:lipid-A-disaccharide synthase [Bacteroidales bacterium]